MHFDTSGLYAAFDRMREQAQAKGRNLADEQARDFLGMAKKEGREIAPTPEKLRETAKRLKWRLKRKPGTSAVAELQRRIRARGTFGRGWKISHVTSDRFKIRIWIRNESAESEKVDTQKGVSDKAAKRSGGKFKQRLDSLANQLTKNF